MSVRRLWALKTNSLCFKTGFIYTSSQGESGGIEKRKEKQTVLTSRKACPLVAASELYVEVGYQSMDVVVPFHLQAER